VNVIKEPVQLQIQAIQHRQPSAAGARTCGPPCRTHMQLPNGPRPKWTSGTSSSTPPRSESRRDTGCGTTHSRGRPERTCGPRRSGSSGSRRTPRSAPGSAAGPGPGVAADMPGRVVLIHRADQPDPERDLDLDGLADLQEPVKALENLQVNYGESTSHGQHGPDRPPPGRHSSAVTSHAGRPSASSMRSSTPVSLSIVLTANPRAAHEATNASMHSDWKTSDQPAARPGRAGPRKTKPGIGHAHTFFAPANSRQHLEDQCLTMNTTSHTRTA